MTTLINTAIAAAPDGKTGFIWLFYVILTCICFAAGAAMQKHGMAEAFPKLTLKTLIANFGEVLGKVLRNWVWGVGVLINLLGGGFYVLSVANGDITIVQPLINLNIVLAMIIGVTVLGERVGAGEWTGALIMVAGAILLGIAAPEVAVKQMNDANYRLFLAAGIGAIGLTAAGGKIVGAKLDPTYFLSATAGFSFGLSMVLVNALLIKLGSLEGVEVGAIIIRLAKGIELWGIIGLNLMGFVFFQIAFSHGRVSIISPITTISAAVLPVLGGFVVFYEEATVLRVVGIVAILIGAALLVLKPVDDLPPAEESA